MKKLFLFVAAAIVGIAASAQSVSIVQNGEEVVSLSPSTIDEIVFSMDSPTGTIAAS